MKLLSGKRASVQLAGGSSISGGQRGSGNGKIVFPLVTSSKHTHSIVLSTQTSQAATIRIRFQRPLFAWRPCKLPASNVSNDTKSTLSLCWNHN